jgi:carboxypeptidase D
LPGILQEIPVLLFSGEYDLICNYIGTEYLIGNMTWNGSKGFSKDTKKEVWKIDNKLAGYYTQERNLIYVLIKDGSHMVPYDRPIECLDMINRFIEVGDNIVKGKLSQVGDGTRPTTTTTTTITSKTSPTSSLTAPSSTNTEKDTKSEDDLEQGELVPEKDKWNQYYNWGTSTLVIVILFALVLCCCWCRNNKRPSASAADEFGGAPPREREGVNNKKNRLFGSIRNLFTYSKLSNANRRKFRLGDNDESNEL